VMGRRIGLAIVMSCLALCVLPSLAAASGVSWTGPYSVDANYGPTLYGVSCAPSSTQCTAVDDIGQEVTFSESAPSASVPVVLGGIGYMDGVSCPSTTQCTGISGSFKQEQEVTFNPQAPGTPTPVTIGTASSYLTGISCADVTDCVAVDEGGTAIAFNPQAPTTKTSATLDATDGFTAVACPEATQCTAVGYGGKEETFDPKSSMAVVTDATVDGSEYLTGIACPSSTQCSATDSLNSGDAEEVTFNPAPSSGPVTSTAGSLGLHVNTYGSRAQARCCAA
jgi:hypothetical protein